MRRITFTTDGNVLIDGRIAGLIPTDLTADEVARLLTEAQANLRDGFAKAALAALPVADYQPGRLIDAAEIASDAYAIGDAMLAERAKRSGGVK